MHGFVNLKIVEQAPLTDDPDYSYVLIGQKQTLVNGKPVVQCFYVYTKKWNKGLAAFLQENRVYRAVVVFSEVWSSDVRQTTYGAVHAILVSDEIDFQKWEKLRK